MDVLMDLLAGLSGPSAYLLIFLVLLACGLGVPIPEDITLFAAGLLSYYEKSNVYLMILISYAGIIIGDSFVFYLGSHYGRRLAKKKPFSTFLHPERFNQVSTKFKKHGNKVIFAARFMPGLRAPIFFTAGTLHLPYRVFFFYDGLAAMISVPAIVYAVYHFGDEVDQVIKMIKRVQNGILFAIIGIVLLLLLKWYWNHRRNKKLKK